jgi:hypothetical protein
MLRNHLIALLAEKDNDTVTVDLSGVLIDIDAVTGDRDCIVLNLNREDVEEVLHRMASGAMPASDALPSPSQDTRDGLS